MASKIWIASKPVAASLGDYDHTYIVYDPDGDPKTGDELVWRGGPENDSAFNLGNINIENWVPIVDSEDNHSPGQDPFIDRNYTPLNTNGKTPEQLKQELSDFARGLGMEGSDGIVKTNIPYTTPVQYGDGKWRPSLNSNSTINSGLDKSGIDFSSNLPKSGGTGPRTPLDRAAGGESYYTSGDGVTKISPTNKDKIIYSGGGSNTYEITPSPFEKGKTVIVEDGNTSTLDKIVLKNTNPEDVKFEKSGNDLHVYYPWDKPGDPSIVIKNQWDKHGVPKMNTLWAEPPGGGSPHVIPLNNPDNFPESETGLPAWIQNALNKFNNGQSAWLPPVSPLVLDLDGDGIELTAVTGSNSVYFDMNNDGNFKEATGWVTGGDGLLAMDRDNNGTIDNQSELFGNSATAANGFLNLKTLDSNGDHKITSADAQWSKLRVWVDENSDGVSQTAELKTLAVLGITSVNLAYTDVNYQIEGNSVQQESTFIRNGQTRTIADVWFSTNTLNTEYGGDYTLDVRALFLPTLRGYGNVKDLHIAMSQDETLLNMVTVLAGATVTDLRNPAFDFNGKIMAMIYRWAGVDGIAQTGGNPSFDDRKLALLEHFLGEEFNNSYVPNAAVSSLTAALNELTGAITKNFFAQMPVVSDLASTYDPISDSGNATQIHILAVGATASPAIPTGASALIIGNESTNTIWGGTNAALKAYGGGGNDTINGRDGNDFIYGEVGNDTVFADAGNDVIEGGDGNDHLQGGDGDDQVSGGLGADNVYGEAGNDIVDGGAGDDNVQGGDGNDTLTGGAGRDYLSGDAGDDTYIFRVGDSPLATTDTITDMAGEGFDIIKLTGGILPQNVTTWEDSNHWLHIKYSPTDEIVLQGYSREGASIRSGVVAAEKIVFDNGTVWNVADLVAPPPPPPLPNPTTGNDVIDASARTAGVVMDLLAGDDTFTGSIYNDDIKGGAGNDIINVGAGVDRIFGLSGSDTLIGGDGNDVIYGSSYMSVTSDGLPDNDIIEGGKGVDDIYGGWGDDTYVLRTGDGNDTIWEVVGQGSDTIKVTGGVLPHQVSLIKNLNESWYRLKYSATEEIRILNTIVNGTGLSNTDQLAFEKIAFDNGTVLNLADLLNATPVNPYPTTSGNDTINASAATAAVTINLQAGNDTFTGSNFNDNVTAGDGNDTVEGRGGNDIMTGGNGTDRVTYASATAAVTVNLATTAAQNTGGAGTDTISTFENLTGSAYNDTLTGNSGANAIDGGSGNDVVDGAAGNDVLTGGAGTDTLSYASATAAVTVNLATTAAQNTVGSGTDTISTFENLTGSNYNDTLTGDANANVIEGRAGNDILNGAAGTDTVTYASATAAVTVNLATTTSQNTVGAGSDTITNFENLTGSNYNDTLTGNTGANRIDGGSGNDTIQGGTGNDTLIGGVGTDTVTFAAATAAVTVNLATTAAQNTVAAGSDTISGFENLTGSGYNDTLRGDTLANTVRGGNGNDAIYGNSGNDILYGDAGTDTLYGDAGNDTLYGGASNDVLYGGANTDIFKFQASGGIDTIKDFKTSELDKLDIKDLLSGYDPATKAITDFIQITTSGTSSIVKIDANGLTGGVAWTQIATLENITGLTDEAALKANGTIIA